MRASDQLAFDFGPAAPRLIIGPAICSASAGRSTSSHAAAMRARPNSFAAPSNGRCGVASGASKLTGPSTARKGRKTREQDFSLATFP